MSILSWFKKKFSKPVRKPSIVQLPSEPDYAGMWPLPDAPDDFGNFTRAKVRTGAPDLDLASKAAKLLFGPLDPKRQTRMLRVVMVYDDGTEQVLLERTGPMRVDLASTPDMPHTITSWKGDEGPMEKVQCEDEDVLRVVTLVLRDQPVESGEGNARSIP